LDVVAAAYLAGTSTEFFSMGVVQPVAVSASAMTITKCEIGLGGETHAVVGENFNSAMVNVDRLFR